MKTAKPAKNAKPKKPSSKKKSPAKPAAKVASVSVVPGFKGFGPDWKCRDMQYEVGKTFTADSASLCNSGLHFCEHPMDVFGYYPPVNEKGEINKFATVEAGNVSEERSSDSKRVATQLTVKAEIGLPGLIKAGVEYIISMIPKEDTATNTGN